MPEPSSVRRRNPWRVAFALLLLPAVASAQEPVKPDTTGARRDSVQMLPELITTVTRTEEPIVRVPQGIGVVERRDIVRGQPNLGPDEFLTNIPGVYVQNRNNPSQGQRIEIRGAGARANFGVRGIKVLLDGVPQTLPDGQTQVTNVDYGLLERVDVLRGAASALYGNATGGVVSYQTLTPGPEAFAQRVRLQAGEWGQDRMQAISSARMGDFSGVLSVSRYTSDGYRQQSAADQRLLNFGATWAPSERTQLDLRFLAADNPLQENPGALNYNEYNANPDSAPANNILRGANNSTEQQQLSASFRQRWTRMRSELQVVAFGLSRFVENPLATGPAGPPSVRGIYNEIDRKSGGVRTSFAFSPGESYRTPRLTAGLDYQRLRDERLNQRSVSGEPIDSILLQQTENVTEVGPFAQVRWTPTERLTLDAGGRYDWVTFEVDDEYFGDGVDNSGELPQNAINGSVGASYFVRESFIPYANIGTAFETPTTTELVNQPGTTGGFNTTLDPQTTVAFEVGARGRVGTWGQYEVAGFVSRVSDAIVAFSEVGGRSYFTNAGKVNNDGLEVNFTATPTARLRAFVSFRYANYRFEEYRLQQGENVDTLDGNRVPGVPRYFTRLGLRTEPVDGLVLDLDHTLSSSLTADDRNTIWVENWGAGVSSIRASYRRVWRDFDLQPYAGVTNLWDRTYIGSVLINGALGRVLEPSQRRNLFFGLEVGFRTRS
ncbi:MAG TPA: TonB-dependent receptor [Gemmatimonadales bacterium]|nr:TonB-dependent receptor [Gemmatimonadales bacterium]